MKYRVQLFTTDTSVTYQTFYIKADNETAAIDKVKIKLSDSGKTFSSLHSICEW